MLRSSACRARKGNAALERMFCYARCAACAAGLYTRGAHAQRARRGSFSPCVPMTMKVSRSAFVV